MARRGFEPRWDISRHYGESREGSFWRFLEFSSFEHKSEVTSTPRTTNLFVEYEQSWPRKPSGIATTEAECWAEEFVRDCWLYLPTRRFKRLCDGIREQQRLAIGGDGLVGGGDNNNRGVLVPWMDLLKIGY